MATESNPSNPRPVTHAAGLGRESDADREAREYAERVQPMGVVNHVTPEPKPIVTNLSRERIGAAIDAAFEGVRLMGERDGYHGLDDASWILTPEARPTYREAYARGAAMTPPEYADARAAFYADEAPPQTRAEALARRAARREG